MMSVFFLYEAALITEKVMNKLETNLHISIVPFNFAFLSSLFVNMTKEKVQQHVNESVWPCSFIQSVCNNYSVFKPGM